MNILVLVDDAPVIQNSLSDSLTFQEKGLDCIVVVAANVEMAEDILLRHIIPPEAMVYKDTNAITLREQPEGVYVALLDYSLERWKPRTQFTSLDLARELLDANVPIVDISGEGDLHKRWPEITAIQKGRIGEKEGLAEFKRFLSVHSTKTPETEA